jgi:hypothetical protein
MPNVTVTLSGSQSVTTQTDANGRYSFTGLPSSGSYTLTPEFAHYTFHPSNLTVTTPAHDQKLDFTATLNHYTIGGSIRDPAGVAVAGVTISLSGSEIAAATTDASGNYSFTVPALGNYTVSPTKVHYVFTPANRTFNNLSGNQTAGFAATLPVTLSGHVTADGAPLPDVTIAITGTESANTMTDASGNYSLAISVGNYVITPSREHYSFNPQTVSLNNVTANQTANFTASLNHYIISGRVLDSSNSGISNVSINLSGTETGSVVTDTNGNFFFAALAAGGSYAVTPSDEDYAFEPISREFADLSADQNLTVVGALLPPELLLDSSRPEANQLVALDSVLLTLGPFRVRRLADWIASGTDQNTRVMIFATNVDLATGENSTAIVVNLVDSNSQSYDVPAEDIRLVASPGITQIVFRLPHNLAPGSCQLKVKLHGLASNVGTLQIVQ